MGRPGRLLCNAQLPQDPLEHLGRLATLDEMPVVDECLQFKFEGTQDGGPGRCQQRGRQFA